MVDEHLSASYRARLREADMLRFVIHELSVLAWRIRIRAISLRRLGSSRFSTSPCCSNISRRSSIASTFQTSSSKSHRYPSVDRYTLFA